MTPSAPEIRPQNGNPGFGGGMKDVKLKFQLVDEYWEKGKKRGRGKKIRVSAARKARSTAGPSSIIFQPFQLRQQTF